MDTPHRLYHATWPSRVDAIAAEGIRPAFDGVYLTSKAGHAAGFMRLRGAEHTGQTREVEFKDRTITVPEIILHDEIVVYEIDPALLDLDRLTVSEDHVVESGIYPADLESWIYAGIVPVNALLTKTLVPREVPT